MTMAGCRAVFDCVFKSGQLQIAGPLAYVAFVDCRFEGDVFEEAGTRGTRAHNEVSAQQLEVKDCTFAEGVRPLTSWERKV